uniref:Uncharacterized protein n=1 Tax=Xiphophorus maculatus TaxID=8083 RepID=A0A3B5QH18_XIPMA
TQLNNQKLTLLFLLFRPERLLPQWLTGIVAVCGFLILTFIAALVKKVWCESSRSVTTRLHHFRPSLIGLDHSYEDKNVSKGLKCGDDFTRSKTRKSSAE